MSYQNYDEEDSNESSDNIHLIKPFHFINAINQINDLELCIMFINQCYAGVFNYWDTYSTKYELCMIGSTGMHSAISHYVDFQDVQCNIFQYFLLRWLFEDERDLDGDDKENLLDRFKFASLHTGKFFLQFRADIMNEIDETRTEIKTGADYLKEKHVEELDELLDSLHTRQEPWILNANLARRINY